jgi:hypothetical protein
MSKIKLNAASGGGSVSVEAPTSTTGNANVELKLPIADGSNGQALTTNGSGQLAFSSVSGTTINNNANNRIITGSGTANTLEAESNLEFDGTSLDVLQGNSAITLKADSETPKILFKANNVTNAAKIHISESGGGGVYKIFTKPTSGPFVERIAIGTDGRVQHDSVDNTAFQLSVAGAVRLQIDHTGGGNIQISNPSSGNVTYSTSSDYRLKENATTINNALTTVKGLKPYQFTWKHDSKIGQGFFAHEVIETTPNSQAALGTKDAVDSENNPIYQQVDYSKLVPLLTAALQEATAKIEVLETKVAALEAA